MYYFNYKYNNVEVDSKQNNNNGDISKNNDKINEYKFNKVICTIPLMKSIREIINFNTSFVSTIL